METFRGYPVKVRRFLAAGRQIELLGPANFETLIDDPRVRQRFDQDEFMPYWAEFWPASGFLVDAIEQWGPASTPAPRVLELGAGLGLAGLAAALLDYEVTISDYEEDCLAFIDETVRRNHLPPVQTRFIDWRRSYPELRYDRIIGAEILYEPRNLEPVASFIREHLAPGGFALIVDAYRTPADRFEATAARQGLSVQTHGLTRAAAETGAQRARLFRLEHSAAADDAASSTV